MSQALDGNIPPEFMFIVVGVNLILLATFGIWLFGSLLIHLFGGEKKGR